jgi:dienelactone hydrolase
MRQFVSTLIVAAASAVAIAGQQAATTAAEETFTVFVRQKPVGQESVRLTESSDGWLIRGSNRLAPPLDVVTDNAEIRYDRSWQPTQMLLEGTARGQQLSIKTTFASGQAASEITVAGQTQTKTDPVAADTIVLPNSFLGSYAALAHRLTGLKPGAELRAYIAPQMEVPVRVTGVFPERIETPRQAFAATRYALTISNPPPVGELQANVWADERGGLLRMSVPSQSLEIARDDIASAAARTTSFSIPGEETVHIPAAGFNLAASVAKPANAKPPLPAVVIVGGITVPDRDGFVGGTPVLGNIAAQLVEDGFLVVRYDRRGVGQSGGRAETATINDYAEDVRAVVNWLHRQRKEIDRDRIALVGHSEGAWIAMRAAARDDRVKALAIVSGLSTTGSQAVLEQQRALLEKSGAPEAEKRAKIELQQRINAAALEGSGWDDIPQQLRNAADTPWFQSYLAFEPARVMRDVRQPVLIVPNEPASAVAPHHAERLAELARARKRKVPADIGSDTSAIGDWLRNNLGVS